MAKKTLFLLGTAFTIAAVGVGVAAAVTKGFQQAPRLGIVDLVTSKNNVYSVHFDAGKTVGVRGDSAKGLVAGINGKTNHFDNIYPWSGMKTIKDDNGDYFIRIPKFYSKIDDSNGLDIAISGTFHKGMTINPAFLDGGRELDYIDIAKYEASLNEDETVLKSVSDVMPVTTGYTLDQARVLAERNGNQLINWRQNQALQMLFTVEFADLDSQSIMAGETQYIALVHDITAEEITAKKVAQFTLSEDEYMLIDGETDHLEFAQANLKHVDLYYEYTKDGEDVTVQETVTAKSVKLENDAWTVTLENPIDTSVLTEDAGITIAFGSYNYHKTGATDGRKGSSNGASAESLENIAMNYRGIENWWGNTWTWCDGLATYQDDDGKYICVSWDSLKNNNRDSYTRYGVENMNSSKAFEKGLYFNKLAVNESGNGYDDFYFNFSNGSYQIGFLGGGYGNSYDAGAFCVDVNNDVSTADYGFRLSCIPQ